MHGNLLAIYKDALRIRAFEKAIGVMADAGHVPGLAHLCLGAEVLQATVCTALNNKTDHVNGSHRSHGIALASGASPFKVAAEILGREDGLSGGLGGTQHLFAPEQGMASNGIVGAQVPLAAGAALTAKTLGTHGIAVCFFGDGAANQGAVLETLNLAAVLSFPLLFILENNGYGLSTSSSYASAGVNLTERAKAFGLESISLPSDPITDQIEQIHTAINIVRTESRPLFLEVPIPRLTGHYHGDAGNFAGGTDTVPDPLLLLKAFLDAQNIDTASLKEQSSTEMNEVAERALLSQAPSPQILDTWRSILGATE
ncbi:MAG: thiamine pyrophosphate-dependent dehydrogenase E1 component subunit alpha [Kordiimonadaceae bacterium]|nr:thiamine pyrophosphate-dependent dehydrogenase E1 component subunit alpha [Kordiimonadaceae bacterium]